MTTRFFVRPAQIVGQTATLDADDAHHLRVVLKAQAGDAMSVLDGTGREWAGRLVELGKARATVTLGEPFFPPTESPVSITIAQALPKMNEKMEQVLQRGTEAGAAAFWAFASARSLPHLTGERHEKRLARWGMIVKTAAEQAHRARLPSVAAEGDFAAVLARAGEFHCALLLHPDAPHSLRSALPMRPPGGAGTVLAVVGPESGFTDAEVHDAVRAGLTVVSLGPRILRTETAAIVLLAQLLFAWDARVGEG